MKKSKKNGIMFLVIILSVAVISGFFFNRYQEGFYSNNSITSAKTTLNDLMSNTLSSLITTLKDSKTNRYNLDITSAIGNLGEEMKDSSPKTRAFITSKKKELSNLQKNMNHMNKAISGIPNITVKQLTSLTDETSEKDVNIIDALNTINTQLTTIVSQLSEIPE